MKKLLQKINTHKIRHMLDVRRYTSRVVIVASLIFLAATNVLFSQITVRSDLSQGQAYSLSTSSKKLIQSLKKPVTISLYVSSSAPSQLQPVRREVVDLLEEYDQQSDRVTFREYDPKTDADAKKRASETGLPEIPFQQLGQNKFEIAASYFGITVESDGKKEVIPQATDVENLEYNITSLIYKLSRSSLPKIAIVGYESPFLPQGDQIANLRQLLRNQFDAQSIPLPTPSDAGENNENTTNTKPFDIGKDVQSLLFFVHSDATYSKEVMDAVKKYIDAGGRAIVFANGVMISDNLQTGPAPAAVLAFLKSYGVTLNTDYVLSTAAELINMGSQQGFSLLTPYPMWIRTNLFDLRSPYFANMNYLTFPWTSSLSLNGKNNNATILVKSTPQSWTLGANAALDPQQIQQPSPKEIRQSNLMAEVKTSRGGRLMIVPSSRFAVDRYAPSRAGNVNFVLNVLNEYASGGALTGIHARTVSFFSLPDMSAQMQQVFQYTNIIFLPALLGLYGTARIYRRGKSRA